MAINIPILSSLDTAGFDKAKKEFQSLEGAGAKAGFAIKKAAVPAGLAIAALGAAAFDAAKGAMEDAAAQEKLANNIKNATGASDKSIASTEKLITKMSLATGTADDELRPAYSKLITVTKDVERTNQLMAIAQDVSSATGKDLETVTSALAKAEMGQYAALKKLGIPMSEGIQAAIDLQKEQKELAKAEKNLTDIRQQMTDGTLVGKEAQEKFAKAQEKVTAETTTVNALLKTTGDYALDVGKAFEGSAAVAAETAEGKFKRLGVSLAETKETIGAALMPVIEAILPKLTAFGEWASENTTVVLVLGGVIGGLAAAIIVVNAAMTAWAAVTKAFAVAQGIFNAVMAANPIFLIVAAVAAIVAALVLLQMKFNIFGKAMEAVGDVASTFYDGLKAGFSGVVSVISGWVNGLIGIYKSLFNGIADIWNKTIGKLDFKIPDWVPVIGGAGFKVPKIPYLAAGGIVNSPTLAMIGEAGPEAVVPLTGRNAANVGLGGGQNITINITGGLSSSAEIGQAVVNAIRSFNVVNGPARISVA